MRERQGAEVAIASAVGRFLFAIILLACAACDPCAHTPFWVDADGDGFGDPDKVFRGCEAVRGPVAEVAGDCDDGDPLINPDALEACDGVDHDCDGEPDDRPLATFYRDVDRDGHGRTNDTMTACFAPEGYVASGDDCNDNSAAISPSAMEDCAPTDRDCDGMSDESPVDAVSYFFDGDGDGEGTYASRVVACFLPSEDHVRSFGDCDDADPLRASAFAERRYTGVDEDCDTETLDDDIDGDGLLFDVDCDDSDATAGLGTPRTPYFMEDGIAAGLTKPSAVSGAWQTECQDAVHAAGAAVGDFDGDGDLDLFLARIGARSELLANDGSGHFTDVSEARGVIAEGDYGAAVFFDLGGDGDLDLYVAAVGNDRGLLFVQAGDGTFAEEAIARGADLPVPAGECALHHAISAADIEADGDIDLLVPSWHPTSPRTAVLLDDGTGHFTRGESMLGLAASGRQAFVMRHADVTGDGRPDVPLVSDFETSGLFVGQANGTFVENTAAGVGTDENGMGTDLADYDADGDLDWFVSSIFATPATCARLGFGCTGNRLYRNDGAGTFTDVTDTAGVRRGGWGWGAAFFDADDDGVLDLGHTNGFTPVDYQFDATRLFMGTGTGTFQERACDHGLRAYGQGRAFIPFDADRDGDLDILITEHGSRPLFFRNPGTPGRSSLTLLLSDQVTTNRNGVGATIWLRRTALGSRVRREITASSTYAGTGPAEAHFGLGNHVGNVAEIEIVWPDGAHSMHLDVAPSHRLVITRTP